MIWEISPLCMKYFLKYIRESITIVFKNFQFLGNIPGCMKYFQKSVGENPILVPENPQILGNFSQNIWEEVPQ